MRIAFIDYVLDPKRPGASGLSDIVWNMARELAAFGDDVHIIGPYSVDPDPVDGITVHRFALPPIGYRNVLGHILIVLAAWRVARRIRHLDAIHAPEYLTTGVIAPFSRVPVLLTTPGNIYERIAHGNPFDPLTTQVFKVAARTSARWCAVINAISHDMAKWWVRTGASEDRVVVIPHGINLSLFRPQRTARSDDAAQSLRLLYVGRFSREKNVLLLPVVMRELTRRAVDARLEIVGEGPLEQQLRAQFAEYGLEQSVTIHGWLHPSELVQRYAAADLLLVPSTSEPLGRVIMESMACGTPVIGSRVGGIPDLIADDVNGYLLNPNDVTAWVERLRQIAESPATLERLRANAVTIARTHWSWNRVMQTFRRAVISRLPQTAEGGGAIIEGRTR